MVKSFIAVGSCVGGDKGNYSIILWHCSIRKGKTANGTMERVGKFHKFRLLNDVSRARWLCSSKSL